MEQTKKMERAVAVVYDRIRADAPLVVAAGKGATAERIIEIARQAGVYVKQDPDLLELLAQVPVGEMIPVELYQAVAEILAFVYRVNERYKQRAGSSQVGA